MSRLQKQPILYQDKLNVPEKYLRFATPGVVADYRADKLCSSDFANTKSFPSGGRVGIDERNCKLVEIGAGIGGQTLAFAKVCKEVLAIESNKESAKILIQNLKKLKIENVEVLVENALSKKSIEKIKHFKPEIIFCDTEREEKGERTLESIKPSIKKILETFSTVTSKIAIEIPPFTKIENFDYNFEKEFISVNQQLNRLTLYFNELKESDISVIALPSREKLISGMTTNSRGRLSEGNRVGVRAYLYVIDPTIILANLISELSAKFDSQILELNKPVLVSDKKINSNFLAGYKIITTCKNEQKEILQNLKKIEAGKIVLRYNIEPKDYWKVRNFYENQLTGTKEISLFIDEKNNEAILCEVL